MKKKILAIQGSKINKINYKTDTSILLGLEAQKRKFDIYYYEPKDLSYNNGKILAKSSKIYISSEYMYPIKIIKNINLDLSKVKILLIRNEPPFNQQYINTTFILDRLSKNIKIINHPKSIREVPEKLFSLKFIKFMPPTLISENLGEIKTFFEKHRNNIVIKPIEGYSGNDVRLIKKFDKKKITKYLKKYNHIIFQKYIAKISRGDKRIFIINGKVMGAISRIPRKGSILSNMSKGAYAKKIDINSKELLISKKIATELKKNNIYFAGIDFVNGKLIGDINVTSPTGLKTYYDLTGINLAEYFFDNIWYLRRSSPQVR